MLSARSAVDVWVNKLTLRQDAVRGGDLRGKGAFFVRVVHFFPENAKEEEVGKKQLALYKENIRD